MAVKFILLLFLFSLLAPVGGQEDDTPYYDDEYIVDEGYQEPPPALEKPLQEFGGENLDYPPPETYPPEESSYEPAPQNLPEYNDEPPAEFIPPSEPSEYQDSYRAEEKPLDAVSEPREEYRDNFDNESFSDPAPREEPRFDVDQEEKKQIEKTEKAIEQAPLEEAEKMVEKLEEKQQKQIDPVSASEKMGNYEDEYAKAWQELEAEMGDDITDDKSYSNLLKIAIAPYKGKPEPKIREMLLERYQDNFFGKLLHDYPKLLNFISATIADPVALPRMGKIIDERNKFYRYIWVNLGVFLMSYVLRKVFLKNKNFSQRMRMHVIIFSFLTVIRVGIFLFFFNFEVERVFEIFTQIFL